MKYLVKFNESENNYGRYFSFITEAQYRKSLNEKDFINFSLDEIKKIRKYVFQPILKIQTRKMILISLRNDRLKILKTYGSPYVDGDVGKGFLEIRKLNDDWYVIYLRTSGSGSSYSYVHVLCDTFKGVRQFLNKINTASSGSIFYEDLNYKWIQKMESNT